MQHYIPKLVALVLAFNGVLCPCATIANQIETAPQSHHHAAIDAKDDCHGSVSTEVCTTSMADTALPKSVPAAADHFQADDRHDFAGTSLGREP